jgi:hypothetical protein
MFPPRGRHDRVAELQEPEPAVHHVELALPPAVPRVEHLPEVELLPRVDDVDDLVGIPRAHAVLDRREVGRAVEVGAVRLLDHEHGVGETRPGVRAELHDRRAVAHDGDVRRDEIPDDAGSASL